MSTAIEIAQRACRLLQLDRQPENFSTTQPYPYNTLLDRMNDIIAGLNRDGNMYFTLTDTELVYNSGQYTFNLTNINIDPARIRAVHRTLLGDEGELPCYQWDKFIRYYRNGGIKTARPDAYGIFNVTLNLSTIPDKNYRIKIHHYRDMPTITAPTDTLLFPKNDEDVLQYGLMFHLAAAFGRDDQTALKEEFATRRMQLLNRTINLKSLPKRLPRRF